MILYVATGNKGKLADFRAAASEGIEIEPLPNLKDIPAPDETGLTFAENATLKAIAYSLHVSDAIVIADDSGIEVDALDGAPGVRSARFAADHGLPETDAANNTLLLEKLSGQTPRTARYRATLAAAKNGQLLSTADGTVEGILLTTPQGTGGFGYDPLFFLPNLNKTMAELTPEEKHTISHRGQALRALLPKL